MPTPREAWSNDVQRQGYGGEHLRAPDFGAAGEMIGRAAQGFGQDMTKVADNLSEIQKRDAETAAREADNLRIKKRMERLYGNGTDQPGFFNQEGRNAIEDREKLDADLAAIDKEAGQLVAHKPFAAHMYNDMTTQRNTDDLPRIAIYTAKQRNVFEDQVDADATNMAINSAQVATDPALIEKNLQTVRDIAARKAQRKGVGTPEGIELAQKAATGVAVEAVASRLEREKGPAEAQAFVVAHADQMDPDDAGKIMTSLARPAAVERSYSDIGGFVVYKGETAPAQPAAPTPTGSAGPTLIPSDAALDAAQFTGPGAQEGATSHTDKNGKLIASPKGALGISQTMVATGYSPGYGVKPLQNQSREEYLRFGREYRTAMIKHFGGNVVVGLTAYNWGPGNVEAHIAKVGDPSKGQISDAAFINSLPNKEAREYAAGVLNKAGVSVSGAPGPNMGKPVEVGREVDLDATINNILKSDRSWVDKQALIERAQSMHGLGQQTKAANEEALRDEAWKNINGLEAKGGFTNYDQLPLPVRRAMETQMPELVHTMRNMAETNYNAQQAALDPAKDAAFKEGLAQLEQGLYALSWSDPKQFQSINFYGSPKWAKMGTKKVTEWMARQQASIESGSGKGANHDSIRTMVNRYAASALKKSPEKMGAYYTAAIQEEERLLASPDRKNKPLTDTEREGIVMKLMTQSTYTTPEGDVRTGPVADARAAGARTYQVADKRAFVRGELQKRLGRIPNPAEVDYAIREYEAEYARKHPSAE